MASDDQLSEAELAFLELQKRPKDYRAWATEVLREWTARRPKGKSK
jgi:hypothetical protein